MKLSARNCLPGTIKSITRGPINAIVVIEVAPQVELSSIITSESSDTLGLKQGQRAYAVIKSSSVMVGVD